MDIPLADFVHFKKGKGPSEIKRVSRGAAVVIPLSEATRGHGSHTIAALWKQHLSKLLEESQ